MEVADRVKHGFLKEQNAQILQRNLFAVATHDPLLRLPPLFVIVVKRIRHGEPRVLARQSSQKRVAQCVVHTDPLRGVEHQHSLQQVDRVRRSMGKALLERLRLTHPPKTNDWLAVVHLLHCFARLRLLDEVQ